MSAGGDEKRTVLVTLRITDSTLARIVALSESFGDGDPLGRPVTMSDALRALLHVGLTEVERTGLPRQT